DMFLQTIELYKRACESNELRMFDTYFPLNNNKQTDEGRQLKVVELISCYSYVTIVAKRKSIVWLFII
ncbi:MAG: hypothetical protein LR001_10760, partial [Clostridiales bacterium]|nr:hypothetical protein [Clostridiales bacterium]